VKKMLSLFLCTLLVLTLAAACAKPTQMPLTSAELMYLGEKYLLEMDYEQAVIYFTQLIELEPMNPRGYAGAANAYIGLNDLAGAEEILNEGVHRFPDNPEIQAVLAQFSLLLSEPEPTTAPTANPTPSPTPEATTTPEPTQTATNAVTRANCGNDADADPERNRNARTHACGRRLYNDTRRAV